MRSADLLEIPNLAQRSSRYYAYFLQRYGFGLSHIQSPVCGAGETLVLGGGTENP